ncbi:MAG TPA: hypothetical protein VME45_19280 [Stellaceae bacterium]|nr:hypothetical protein [Stellaceae bacterium]
MKAHIRQCLQGGNPLTRIEVRDNGVGMRRRSGIFWRSAPKYGWKSARTRRAIAYRFRLGKVVEEYLDQLQSGRDRERFANCVPNERPIGLDNQLSCPRPAPLNNENWEMHALLGHRAVELILAIDDASGKLAAFDQEIRLDATRTGDHFAAGTLRLVEQNRFCSILRREGR